MKCLITETWDYFTALNFTRVQLKFIYEDPLKPSEKEEGALEELIPFLNNLVEEADDGEKIDSYISGLPGDYMWFDLNAPDSVWVDSNEPGEPGINPAYLHPRWIGKEQTISLLEAHGIPCQYTFYNESDSGMDPNEDTCIVDVNDGIGYWEDEEDWMVH